MRHDLDSAFTPVYYGPVRRRKGQVLTGVSGHPVGLRWIEQENLAFGLPPVREPKGRSEFLELADDSQEVDLPQR